jgi:hypothetical protein
MVIVFKDLQTTTSFLPLEARTWADLNPYSVVSAEGTPRVRKIPGLNYEGMYPWWKTQPVRLLAHQTITSGWSWQVQAVQELITRGVLLQQGS